MGTFSLSVNLAAPEHPERRLTLDLLVDTGATWTMLPEEAVRHLGLSAARQRSVTLEEFALAPDPVRKALVPVAGLLA